MKSALFVAALLLATPTLGAAAPCVPDSLAAYIALGSVGCEISLATFSDFSAEGVGLRFSPIVDPVLIDPAEIQVVPSFQTGWPAWSSPRYSGPQFEFLLNSSVGPGEAAGIAIGFTAIGEHPLKFVASSLAYGPDTVGGNTVSVSGDGEVWIAEDYCFNGTFGPGSSTCSGQPGSGALSLFRTVTTSSAYVLTPFGPFPFVDVSLYLTLNGGVAGTAGINGAVGSVTNQFGVVPEPASAVLVCLGLSMFAALRRRQQSPTPGKP